MQNSRKLMKLAMLMGSVFLERLLLKRFVAGIAGLLIFAIIIAVMGAALLLVGFYVAYRLLLEHGLTTDMALYAVVGAGLVFILMLIAIAVHRFRTLCTILKPQPALASYIGNAAEAFVDGLMTASVRKEMP